MGLTAPGSRPVAWSKDQFAASVFSEIVVASLAGPARGGHRRLDVIEATGFRNGGKLGHFSLHLVGVFLEFGGLFPNLRLGPGLTFAGPFTKGSPGKLGHKLRDRRTVSGHLGVERRFARCHGSHTAKVLLHDKRGTLAVF